MSLEFHINLEHKITNRYTIFYKSLKRKNIIIDIERLNIFSFNQTMTCFLAQNLFGMNSIEK